MDDFKSSKVIDKSSATTKKFSDDLIATASETGNLAMLYEQNQKTSPLLKLAGEIRNRIFEYVFLDQKQIGHLSVRESTNIPVVLNVSDVLSVCRQIHNEYRLIAYHDLYIIVGIVRQNDEWSKFVNMALREHVKTLDVEIPITWGLVGLKSGIIHFKQGGHGHFIYKNLPALKKVNFTYKVIEEAEKYAPGETSRTWWEQFARHQRRLASDPTAVIDTQAICESRIKATMAIVEKGLKEQNSAIKFRYSIEFKRK